MNKKVNRKKLYVLIACEESQRVCMAFRELGHVAFSADLQKAGGGHEEWHIKGDVTKLLRGKKTFTTQDHIRHRVPRWDLIICHPPCTYLCKVSAVKMVKKGQIDKERYIKMMEARDFFFRCLNAKANFVAVENPLPMARACLPLPTTWIQPYEYGHAVSKKTLLWLKGLPPLMPVKIVIPKLSFCNNSRGKYRSRTFRGVAQAMANQWSKYILKQLNS